MGCNTIRKQIDEADRPDAFSFEVSGHVASCEGCRSFADDRARLRSVLSSGARVQAPADFDAALRSRLETIRARRAFSWLAPAALMRMSAAAAAAVIVVFVAQYALLPGEQTPSNNPPNDDRAAINPVKPETPAPPPVVDEGIIAKDTVTPLSQTGVRSSSQRGKRTPVRIDHDLDALDPHLVIVRGERGDREVPIFTVSVGAQPHLYGTSSAPQARLARASF